MQHKIATIFSKIIIFVTGLSLAGCASDPVPIYLPSSHPAHPEAAEVVYTEPPNPFQDGLSKNKMQSDRPTGTPMERPGETHSHSMKSGDQKNEKSSHHHREHK